MESFRIFIATALVVSSFQATSAALIDSTGRTVAEYTGLVILPDGLPGGGQSETAVSLRGYRFAFNRESGKILIEQEVNGIPVYFASQDCTGQAYTQSGSGIPLAGSIFPSVDDRSNPAVDGPLYYIPQQRPSPVSVGARSAWSTVNVPVPSVVCFVYPQTQQVNSVPIQPNDPVETGVPNSRLQAPLRVGSTYLFRNGFESELG